MQKWLGYMSQRIFIPSALFKLDSVCWVNIDRAFYNWAIYGWVCKREGLKVNGEKSKVIVIAREGTPCRIWLDDDMHLELVSEFKYLGFLMLSVLGKLRVIEK